MDKLLQEINNKLLQEINSKLLERIEHMFKECIQLGYTHGKSEVNNYYKHTEKRLYAFKQLQKNVLVCQKDIEDLRKEKTTGKSKDIVRMQQSGVRLDCDEILKGKVLSIQMKIDRDIREINELKRALSTIKKISNHEIIHYKYFEELTDSEIAEKLHMSERTVRRSKKQLINKLMIALYGADVI